MTRAIVGRSEKEARVGAFFQSLGQAVWHAQRLEETMASYIVVRLRETRGVGLEQGMAIDGEVSKKTMGTLLSELSQAQILPDALAGRFGSIVSERNWMVHRLGREERRIIDRPEDYRRTIGRLQRIVDESLSLNKTLGREVEEYVVSAGVSRQYIDQEATRLLASWESGSQ